MADHVSSLGAIASGPPAAPLVAVQPRPTVETPRPAKAMGSQAQLLDARPLGNAGNNQEVAVEQLNTLLQQAASDLKLRVDTDSGRTIFQVVAKQTGEVLLQIPSEEVLAMARKLREFAKQTSSSGVLMDKEG